MPTSLIMSSAILSPHSPLFLELANVCLRCSVVSLKLEVTSSCFLIRVLTSANFSPLVLPTSSIFFWTSVNVLPIVSTFWSISAFLLSSSFFASTVFVSSAFSASLRNSSEFLARASNEREANLLFNSSSINSLCFWNSSSLVSASTLPCLSDSMFFLKTSISDSACSICLFNKVLEPFVDSQTNPAPIKIPMTRYIIVSTLLLQKPRLTYSTWIIL